MRRVGRMTLAYGHAPSRIERWRQSDELWRQTEAAHAQMMEIFEESRRRFEAGPTDDLDRIRFACADVLMAASRFVQCMGVSLFAKERLDEMIFSFERANWGRSAPLLARAKMNRGVSPSERFRQGAAQTCVELFRAARLPATEARRRTARLFQLKKVKGLGVETLAKLGSRLSGRGAREDPLYDYYRMSMDFARNELDRRGGLWPPTLSQAENIAKVVLKMAMKADRAPK